MLEGDMAAAGELLCLFHVISCYLISSHLISSHFLFALYILILASKAQTICFPKEKRNPLVTPHVLRAPISDQEGACWYASDTCLKNDVCLVQV